MVDQSAQDCDIVNEMETQHDRFARFLVAAIEHRSWSFRELARRARISHVTISQIVNIPKAPGYEVAKKLADALGESDVKVLPLAGLLSPVPEVAAREEELIAEYRSLPAITQEVVLSVLRTIRRRITPSMSIMDAINDLGIDEETKKQIMTLVQLWQMTPEWKQHDIISQLRTAAETPPRD